MNTHPLILAAEDEETDGLLLREALKIARLPNPLAIVRDGEAVVDYLTGTPPYQDRQAHPMPGLLLLDLKMPRMNGFDVLKWLASRPEFQELPVIVLSSSEDRRDVDKARQMGARDYFVKPHDYRNLAPLLIDCAQRWLAEASDAR